MRTVNGERAQFGAGVMIAVVGLGAVWWSYDRSASSVPMHTAGLARPPASGVLDFFNALAIDTTPTKESLPEVLRSVRTSVCSACTALGSGVPEPTDLATAAETMLGSMLAGDYDARRAFLLSRGSIDRFDADDRKVYESQAELIRFAPVGLKGLTVNPVSIAGRPAKNADPDSRFARTTVKPIAGMFPSHAAIESAGATVVEVRLPMQLAGAPDRGEVVSSVGLRFAWDGKAKRWTPWSMVVVRPPDRAVFAPPF